MVAAPDAIADAILARYGDVLTRVSFDTSYATDLEIWPAVVAALQAA